MDFTLGSPLVFNCFCFIAKSQDYELPLAAGGAGIRRLFGALVREHDLGRQGWVETALPARPLRGETSMQILEAAPVDHARDPFVASLARCFSASWCFISSARLARSRSAWLRWCSHQAARFFSRRAS